jgi:hypothetical protein
MFRFITGLLILAVLVGGGLYLTSDKIKAWWDQRWTGMTEWTPENIAKDPAGYLTWAQGEFTRIEGELKGHKQALLTRKVEVQAKLKDEDAAEKTLAKVLTNLKGDYRGAVSTGDWTEVKVDGRSVSESEMRELILEADAKHARAERKQSVYRRYQTRVEEELKKVDKLLKDLQTMREEIDEQLEYVKMDKTVADYTSLMNKVDSVLNTSQAIRENETDKLSVDDLVKLEERNQKLEDEKVRFDRIMESN